MGSLAVEATGWAAVVGLAWLLAVAPPLHAGADEAPDHGIKGRFAGWVLVDATGRVRSFEPDGEGSNPALVSAVTTELARVELLPARTADGPVATRAYVSGGYRLREDGDDLVLELGRFALSPKVLSQETPPVPSRLLQQQDGPGWGRVAFAIGQDGRPVDIEVEHVSLGVSARDLRATVGKWRFEPPSTPRPWPAPRYRMPFVFGLKGKPEPEPDPCPPDESGRARLPEQDSCLATLTMILDLDAPTLAPRHIHVTQP